jgi:DNA processing protein
MTVDFKKMNHQELLHLIALQHIPGIGSITAKRLLESMGSATQIFAQRTELPHLSPHIQPSLVRALDCPAAFHRAQQELEFITKHHITCISLLDEGYPTRLRECDDAPSLLFYRGNTTFNPRRVVSIIGTRKCTDYGRDLCERFVRDLASQVPDTLIVSGLAYGIDVCAHRAALKYGLPTIGVLAHGLDRIYPSAHRNIAAQMTQCGGLLTEYPSFTEPERQNFLQRNRIVAGMADATIVIESAAKGGALVTANIAGSYGRDCYAFPGRVDDAASAGCHRLIRHHQAALITSASDFIEAMMWDTPSSGRPGAIQQTLFPDLSDEEARIVALLEQHADGMHINTLVIETDIPINRLSALLFELELRGIVRPLAGSCYKLLR